jgi:hypothetical protein
MEGRGLEKRFIQKLDFFVTHSCVLRKLAERFAVSVKLRQVHHVFVHIVQCLTRAGSREKNAGVATLNCIFLAWRFVVWGGVDLVDLSKGKGAKQALI